MLRAFQRVFCQPPDTSRTISSLPNVERYDLAINVATVLARNLLFRGLPSATLEQIARLCLRRTYPRDAVIFSQADPGDALFGVVTGRVRISASSASGREVFLNIMEPGDTFGEIALLDGRPRTASARAIAPSDLLIIQREQFLRLLGQAPQLTDHLLRLLCARLRWVSGVAEESALLSVPARLARRLLSLGRLHGHRIDAGTELKVSQEEVARFLGLSRQIVNQHLQNWKAQHWVDLGRGRITILNGAALDAVVASEHSSASDDT
jgi:CRP/FNR family transcriptional regulator, cyclic AMP receptor protein